MTRFSERTRNRFPESHAILLDRLEEVTINLGSMAGIAVPRPTTLQPVDRFNETLVFAASIYANKLLQLFEAVSASVEHRTYVIYAQAGRAILENVATLRYYSRDESLTSATASFANGRLTDALLRKANETLDRFVRGNRFSWTAFIEGRLDELSENAHQEHLTQVNSLTCLGKWYSDAPNVKPLYQLFCDLVHPNMGSNLMVMSSRDGGLISSPGGEDICTFVIAPTLAGLLGAEEEFSRAANDLLNLALRIP